MLGLLVIGLALGHCMADYNCLCTYSPQKPFYSTTSTTSTRLGNLNENDCKEVIVVPGIDTSKWAAIAYQHQVVYVGLDDETEVIPCQGNPPMGDILTTGSPGGGSQQTTAAQTQTSTVTTQKPITTVTTQQSTSMNLTMSSSKPVTTGFQTTGAPQSTSQSTTRGTTVAPYSSGTQPPTGTSGSGNTSLCSATVRLYAQQDNEVLVQNGGSCYTIVPHRVSWRHAEGICSHRGGHLFHVSSAAENNFMYNLLNTRFNHSVWMGLHDIGHEEQFTWISGNPVSYTNWYPNRKSNFYSHNVEDCSVFVPYLNHGQWDDIPCGSTSSSSIIESLYETHYFVCQFAISKPTPMTSGNTNLCPASVKYYAQRDHATLAQYGSSCYEWVNQRASWSHAESNCQRRGGHLVQVSDAQEEAFIQKFMLSHDSQHAIWIGLHDQGHEETFTWTSGEPVSYTNWVPGRKSNFQSHYTEDCVAYIPYKQGGWDDIPCGSSSIFFGDRGETHPYMCEFKTSGGTNPNPGIVIG